MANSEGSFTSEIKMNNEPLKVVDSFKYLGAIIDDTGSKADILARTGQTIAALSRLNVIWYDKSLKLKLKIRLIRDMDNNEGTANKTCSELLVMVIAKKLRWFGHMKRSNSMSKTILQGSIVGKIRRGRLNMQWQYNIVKWTGLDINKITRSAENIEGWKIIDDEIYYAPTPYGICSIYGIQMLWDISYL